MSEEQLRRLTARLHRNDGGAISAEWELIVLTALSYVGCVEHEPRFDGPRKLDFRFDLPGAGVKLVGDITSLSDGELKKNSVDFLERELIRRLGKLGIRGSTVISVSCGSGPNRRPILPDPHEFKRYVFNDDFVAFANQITADLSATHVLNIENEKAKLTIQFSSGASISTITYRDFNMPHDMVNNVVHHAIQSKHDQIKGSDHPQGDGWRCVVLCDGDCAALTGQKGWGHYSAREIITRYLDEHRSLDLVVCVSIKSRSGHDGGLEFSVEAFDGPNSRAADSIQQLFRSGLARLPRPVRTAVNAKHYLKRRVGTGISFDECTVSSFRSSDGFEEFTFSSRAIFDYITARIDRATFEMLVRQPQLEFLRRLLDEGSLPVEVTLIRTEELDDDAVSIKLGAPDPAVLPRPPKTSYFPKKR